jgi:hypothetical protein
MDKVKSSKQISVNENDLVNTIRSVNFIKVGKNNKRLTNMQLTQSSFNYEKHELEVATLEEVELYNSNIMKVIQMPRVLNNIKTHNSLEKSTIEAYNSIRILLMQWPIFDRDLQKKLKNFEEDDIVGITNITRGEVLKANNLLKLLSYVQEKDGQCNRNDISAIINKLEKNIEYFKKVFTEQIYKYFIEKYEEYVEKFELELKQDIEEMRKPSSSNFKQKDKSNKKTSHSIWKGNVLNILINMRNQVQLLADKADKVIIFALLLNENWNNETNIILNNTVYNVISNNKKFLLKKFEDSQQIIIEFLSKMTNSDINNIKIVKNKKKTNFDNKQNAITREQEKDEEQLRSIISIKTDRGVVPLIQLDFVDKNKIKYSIVKKATLKEIEIYNKQIEDIAKKYNLEELVRVYNEVRILLIKWPLFNNNLLEFGHSDEIKNKMQEANELLKNVTFIIENDIMCSRDIEYLQTEIKEKIKKFEVQFIENVYKYFSDKYKEEIKNILDKDVTIFKEEFNSKLDRIVKETKDKLALCSSEQDEKKVFDEYNKKLIEFVNITSNNVRNECVFDILRNMRNCTQNFEDIADITIIKTLLLDASYNIETDEFDKIIYKKILGAKKLDSTKFNITQGRIAEANPLVLSSHNKIMQDLIKEKGLKSNKYSVKNITIANGIYGACNKTHEEISPLYIQSINISKLEELNIIKSNISQLSIPEPVNLAIDINNDKSIQVISTTQPSIEFNEQKELDNIPYKEQKDLSINSLINLLKPIKIKMPNLLDFVELKISKPESYIFSGFLGHKDDQFENNCYIYGYNDGTTEVIDYNVLDTDEKKKCLELLIELANFNGNDDSNILKKAQTTLSDTSIKNIDEAKKILFNKIELEQGTLFTISDNLANKPFIYINIYDFNGSYPMYINFSILSNTGEIDDYVLRRNGKINTFYKLKDAENGEIQCNEIKDEQDFVDLKSKVVITVNEIVTKSNIDVKYYAFENTSMKVYSDQNSNDFIKIKEVYNDQLNNDYNEEKALEIIKDQKKSSDEKDFKLTREEITKKINKIKLTRGKYIEAVKKYRKFNFNTDFYVDNLLSKRENESCLKFVSYEQLN